MRRRIVALYLVLAVIVSALISYTTYRYAYDMYINEVKSSLQHEAVLISYMMKDMKLDDIGDKYLADISEAVMSSFDPNTKAGAKRRITLIDPAGDVLADSYGQSLTMGNHSERPEVKEALAEGIGADIRKSETTGLNLIYLASYSKSQSAILRISASLDYIINIRNTIILYEIVAIIVAMAISSLLAIKLSNYAIKPLALLVKKYGRPRKENLKKGRREDEVGELSYTLGAMTRDIEEIIRELKERNARVDTIINSMDAGLIAVDNTMHILMINPIACKLFGLSGASVQMGVPLVQVIRNRQLNNILLKTIAGNKVINDQINLYQGGKRILSLHASPVYPMDKKEANIGALVYIHDITQIRKLEEMRSEFVSNVTHELKTPLTSIHGFVETLKDGAINDAKVASKFLDIIEIEADRLRILIDDILELSEIESMKEENDRQPFALLPLAQEIESMLNNAASEKGVTLHLQIDPHLILKANRHRMKQLLLNLVDNGIKYNKPGGTVTVTAEQAGSQVEIHVKDTGIGIPLDHTDRIFERFYRVDKGRSRAMGGTGLGLSIVKHIAQLYGGSVRVMSEEGKGSDFAVFIER
ncbi:MAG TPA: PAS domain-containing sensor histidine kinase [Ruminiclostridium sp.]|nr:PAS domain-containing sensor histidine kinase [Ruminiclostridium sp.]